MTVISVYQDNDLPSLPVTTSRSKIANTNTNTNTHAKTTTGSKMMRPGRTPLGKRTNSTSASASAASASGTKENKHNHKNAAAAAPATSSLQSFRRSLMSPPRPRSKPGVAAAATTATTVGKSETTNTNTKSVTFQHKDKENANTNAPDADEDTYEETALPLTTASPATASEPEPAAPIVVSRAFKSSSMNTSSSANASAIPTPTRRSKAQDIVRTKAASALFRRLSKTKTVSLTASTTHSSNTRSTSRMPPQTPNSMLKDEIEIANADESILLLSPAPCAHVSRPVTLTVGPSLNLNVNVEPPLIDTGTKTKAMESQIELATNENETNHRQVDTLLRSTWSRVMPSVVAGTVAPPTNTKEMATSMSMSTNQQVLVSSPLLGRSAITTCTPFTNRGNGVCMDLSDIFYDAASTARKQRPTAPLPIASMTATKTAKSKVKGHQSTKKKNKVHTTTTTKAHHSAVVVPPPPAEEEVEDWAEKQCETFSNWLNYTFNPSEERDHQDQVRVTMMENNGHGGGRNSTQDNNRVGLGLRTLVLHQRMAQARQKALEIFHSQEMARAKKVILSEISRGRISIRKDRDMYADLTLRNQITSLLLSYTTPWLRLGLETLFGESILPQEPHQLLSPNNKVANGTGGVAVSARPRKSERIPMSPMKLALKNFIVQRVLSDKATLAKYTKGLCKVPSGNFEKKYQAEMRTLVLHRLLVLFFFLDRARKAHVLDKSPRLFTKDAQVKSSRELLLEFCRQFLSAEGDFVKHLTRVGLQVFYKQEPVDELDFTITNLAVDIRDGVRLARMTEILTGEPPKSLLVSLRLPAVSRLQKLHNVGVVLKTLRNFGVPLSTDIASHHIVDGHREMVLKLMWATVAHCCLKELLDVEQVEAEIQRIRRSSAKSRRRLTETNAVLERKAGGDSSTDHEEAELKSLLLRWCEAVCSCFGVQVNDLTTDFADGKASCLLIHYYHPNALQIDEIHTTSNDLPRNCLVTEAALEKARANERANAVLANNRISELGGIPKMIPVCDTANVPEEKSMLLCLSFMCSRLMESGAEIRSCVLIQRRYRRYRNAILAQKKRSATVLIVRAWRENRVSYYKAQRRKYGAAVIVLQRFIKANHEKLMVLERQRRAKQHIREAAMFIQKHVRGYIVKLRYLSLLRLRRAVRTLQYRWRLKNALRLIRTKAWLRESATTIQRVWRGFQLRSSLAGAAAIKIQALWRGFFVQLQYQIDLLDIITIQSHARMLLAKKERAGRYNAVQVLRRAAKVFLMKKQEERLESQQIRGVAAAKCQMLVRRFLVQKHGMQFRAAVCLQAVWRRCLAQKSLEERRLKSCATVLLQSVWRSAVARWYVQEVRQQHRAVICLQSVWRSAVARSYVQEVRQQHHAVICLQSAWRSFGARSDVQKMRVRSLAAIALQSAWRSSVARSNVHEVRQQYHAVICLQSAWRSYVTRSQVQEVRAVICLQSAWRSYVARSQVRVMRVQSGAVICLQCAWRSSVVRSYLQEVRQQSHAVVCLQSAWRSFVAQLYVHEMRVRSQAAIGLQSAWRGYLAQTRWSEMKLAVTCLQACARKRTARLQFCSVRAGAVTIQAIWRAQLASKKYTGCVHQIVVSQSYVRRKAACIEAARRRTAIILVQSSLRRVNAMRLCDALRETLRNQTIAASAIQRCWRGFCVFVKFHLVISDAITLQNAFRRALATMVARKRLGAVLDLQRSARCWVARRYLFQLRSERDERLRLEMSSALSIQSLFRGHLVRREFLLLNTCAALIQQKTRGYLSQINYRMDLIDIIISQSVVRQWRARRISVLRRESAVLLQAIARMYIAKREVIALRKMMNQVEYERSAALSIQTAYRGFVATRAVSKALAARRIQKTWRCYTVHVDFMLSILAAISIQTSARRFLCERAYCKRLDAVVSVQSFARRVLRQIRVSRIERNAIILQSFARMSFTRARFRLERTAVLMIQRRVRGYLARLELDVQTFAACEIQRIWRGYDAFVDFAWAMLSVIKIQSIVRMRFAQQRLDTLRTERLATKILRVRSSRIIQRVFRDHVSRVRQDQAARTLQRAVKFFLSKAAFSKLRKSTVQIQSIIRGQLTRRLRPKKIKIQLLRIERANIRAKADPKLRLGNRTRTALDVLQTSSRLAEIMNAICTLEIATRLSDVCCASFAEAKAPDILFSLIRTCNRSLPHVELLHHTLLTMSNVAQYDDLMHSMATVTGVEVFLDLVQMFRDKDGVFCLAVSLLERVVRCSEDFQVLCSSRENLKRLKGVHALCVRKLSISHVGSVSIGRESMFHAGKVNTVRMTRRDTDLRQGVRTLQRVINLVDSERT